ncbi:MAG: hypothetical protein R2834_23940 [Rhodothermales bacterium]
MSLTALAALTGCDAFSDDNKAPEVRLESPAVADTLAGAMHVIARISDDSPIQRVEIQLYRELEGISQPAEFVHQIELRLSGREREVRIDTVLTMPEGLTLVRFPAGTEDRFTFRLRGEDVEGNASGVGLLLSRLEQ